MNVMDPYQKNKVILLSMLILLLFLFFGTVVIKPAASSLRIVLDNKELTLSAAPVIKDGRVLVPIRFVSENLGAQVIWNGIDRTVTIKKDSRSVLLRIDSHLIRYMDQIESYDISDVAPILINDRTFVPLRLVSNALGISVKWDGNSKTVYIDSDQKADYMTFFDMKISSVKSHQLIKGSIGLQTSFNSQIPSGAVEIRYLLLNKNTAKGVVVMRGDQITNEYLWKPEPTQNGYHVLVSAVYDINGDFLAGTSMPVQISIEPNLSLKGLVEGQEINETVLLGAVLDFSAYYVKFTVTNLENGKVFVSPEIDPQENYKWTPMMEDNGPISVKVIAYDQNDQAYESREINATVLLHRKLSIAGIPSSKIIDGEIALSTVRNFQVSQTEYVMKDPLTMQETVLAQIGWGSYKWFPSPDLKGEKELFVRVKDVFGASYTSNTVNVDLTVNPKINLEGIGPHQVVTGTVKLKVKSNVALENVKYVLTNTGTGASKTLNSSEFTPAYEDAGNWKIHAEGVYGSSKKVISSEIPFKIYTSRIYSSIPIVDKSKFIELVSEMAIESQKKTGMSAALQIAQAIHETNWGQNIPVDKYKGLVSYNLFGIKGTGPAGSVVSNTWEEYNGVAYRVDDKFRAYSNIQESWSDHKKLLLTADRYQIFRDVMHDSTKGAFALRRAGYATDSKYPIKLINIIKIYGLKRFDESGI